MLAPNFLPSAVNCSSFASFSYKTSLIQGGKLNKSTILEHLATLKLLLSRNPLSKDLKDLCVKIFEIHTAIQLEIAKRDPGFAVVSNVGYAPFHSQLYNAYATTKRHGCFYIPKSQSVRTPVGAARLQRPQFLAVQH